MSVMIKEAVLGETEIVAQAEAALADISRVKQGIGRVIFGQESVVERSLVALLAGGHALAGRRAGACQDQARRNARHRARPGFPPHPVHAGPDAVRHSGLRGDGAGRARQAILPLHLRADFRAAADGRRDQSRQPAHPVGAAAVHAGVPCHGGRRPPRPAEPVPCARHAEPAGAGGHLPASRGTARPFPDAGRHPLPGIRSRAAHPGRDDRRRRREGARTSSMPAG